MIRYQIILALEGILAAQRAGHEVNTMIASLQQHCPELDIPAILSTVTRNRAR